MGGIGWEKTGRDGAKKVRTNDGNALKTCIKLSRNRLKQIYYIKTLIFFFFFRTRF